MQLALAPIVGAVALVLLDNPWRITLVPTLRDQASSALLQPHRAAGLARTACTRTRPSKPSCCAAR
jgi:hypothetical protein